MDQVVAGVTKERPTDEELQAALAQKGGYLYRIDPRFDPAGRVPPEGVMGAWTVNALGEIVGEFERNPRYRPASPAGS